MHVGRRDPQVFHLKHYGLKVNSACYLVTVCQPGKKESPDLIQDLPDWVFTSKHAVWLTEEEKPIGDRARHGDEIRKQLSARRKNEQMAQLETETTEEHRSSFGSKIAL